MSSSLAIAARLALLALASTAVGCGNDANIVPVAGVVTHRGAPLAGARVVTQPIAKADSAIPGSGSFGLTDDAGRYQLELVNPPRPGAVVGEHVVRVIKVDAVYKPGQEDAPLIKSSGLPPSAADGSLRLVVPPAGIDSANFDL